MSNDPNCPHCQGTGERQSASYDGKPLVPCDCGSRPSNAIHEPELLEALAEQREAENADLRAEVERLKREKEAAWYSACHNARRAEEEVEDWKTRAHSLREMVRQAERERDRWERMARDREPLRKQAEQSCQEAEDERDEWKETARTYALNSEHHQGKLEALREALHRISLASANTSSTMADLGKEARAALAGEERGDG